MNKWKQIYGPVPQGFEDSVEKALAAVKRAGEARPAQPPVRKAARRTRRTVLLAAAFAGLLTVTAFAAGAARLGLFNTLFGTGAVDLAAAEATATPAPPGPELAEDGTITQQAYEYTIPGNFDDVTRIMPGYERSPVDEAQAEALLGPYIRQLDKSYVLPNETGDLDKEFQGQKNIWGEITVTLLSYIEDEAGTGYVYYSVECPEGVKMDTRQEQGYTVTDDWFWGGSVHRPGGHPVLVDTDNSTDTEVYLGVPIANADDGLNYVEIQDGYGNVGGFSEKYDLEAERLVPAVTADGEYVRACVSPMGARLTAAEGKTREVLIDALGSFVITMTDGSEYVVYRDDDYSAEPVENTTYLCGAMDGSARFCFNRLVDTAQIASVTVAVSTARDSAGARIYETETIEF